MLALKTKTTLAVLITAITIGFNSSDAQQPPSQRYQPLSQPTTNQPSPPSVHVPPQNARQLSTPQYAGTPAATFQSPDRSKGGQSGTSYRFSDATSEPTQGAVGRADLPAGYQRGAVIQTSYDSDAQPAEPVVPDILAGAGTGAPNQAAPVFNTPRFPAGSSEFATNPAQAPTATVPRISELDSTAKPAGNSPQQFANQMNQIRNDSPRIAPQEFTSSNQIRKEFDDLQREVAKRQQAKSEPVSTPAATAPQNVPTADQLTGSDGSARTPSAAFPAEGVNPTRNIPAPLAHQPVVPETNSSESASEFISKLNPIRNNNSFDSPSDVQPAGGATTLQNASPATMHVPDDVVSAHDTNVRPVSGESAIPANASIKLTAPSIEVETYGPQSVGINKPAVYKVVVTNVSNTSADRILVGVDMPTWIDIENVNMTGGNKEITDGKQQSRLIWSIDQIPGNGSQTITITAVPRKAETFDLGIEWTLAPRAGAANIRVTEPKLEMSIVGPDEVQYGEQALYHVTVKNPGSGTAENVIVMLPEALGGERASLGNIPAGKDKNFQVELLARTAGQLNLVATAVAEGNLEVAADRKLIVRRAKLGIAIDGPSMKYAGGIGEYYISISNDGDATASEIVAAMALPSGVKFVGGIETFKLIDGGLRWQVGSLDAGQKREYVVNCQLDTSGDLQLEVGAQGRGDLQAASACVTKVETVADLVLSVHDPKGPLPTGKSTMYEITIRNRGTRAAKSVNVVMQFSEGIEPKSAVGLEHRLVPGQVLFAPISQIEPGQEISFKVDAEAFKPGTHVFRAQLICEESDSREIAEGTTKFFGEEIRTPQQNTANQSSEVGGSQDFSSGIQR